MKVKPNLDYELLGTGIKLDHTRVYEAEWAINQPDWVWRGALFVQGAAGDTSRIGFLLEEGEYEMIEEV